MSDYRYYATTSTASSWSGAYGTAYTIPNPLPAIILTMGPPGIWISHNLGTMIPIKDMQNDYLKNAIDMVERGFNSAGNRISGCTPEKLKELKDEAMRRGLIELGDWDI